MADSQLEKIVKDHEGRIRELEALLLNKESKSSNKEKSVINKYSGPKGGVLLLLDNPFFNPKSTAAAVHAELDKKGYVYRKVVVQTALRRLSNPKGPLVKVEESGKQVYVQRK